MIRATDADDIHNGAVLLFHTLWTASASNGEQLLASPAWGVCLPRTDAADDEYIKVHWLLDQPRETVAHIPYDECYIVPEDEWPEEVCAALAKHTLLGDLT